MRASQAQTAGWGLGCNGGSSGGGEFALSGPLRETQQLRGDLPFDPEIHARAKPPRQERNSIRIGPDDSSAFLERYGDRLDERD
jgi:hypothetical protein